MVICFFCINTFFMFYLLTNISFIFTRLLSQKPSWEKAAKIMRERFTLFPIVFNNKFYSVKWLQKNYSSYYYLVFASLDINRKRITVFFWQRWTALKNKIFVKGNCRHFFHSKVQQKWHVPHWIQANIVIDVHFLRVFSNHIQGYPSIRIFRRGSDIK